MTPGQDARQEGKSGPVCAFHGKPWSEHPHGRCLYCALCFTTLDVEDCYVTDGGFTYDVCKTCGPREFAR